MSNNVQKIWGVLGVQIKVKNHYKILYFYVNSDTFHLNICCQKALSGAQNFHSFVATAALCAALKHIFSPCAASHPTKNFALDPCAAWVHKNRKKHTWFFHQKIVYHLLLEFFKHFKRIVRVKKHYVDTQHAIVDPNYNFSHFERVCKTVKPKNEKKRVFFHKNSYILCF